MEFSIEENEGGFLKIVGAMDGKITTETEVFAIQKANIQRAGLAESGEAIYKLIIPLKEYDKKV